MWTGVFRSSGCGSYSSRSRSPDPRPVSSGRSVGREPYSFSESSYGFLSRVYFPAAAGIAGAVTSDRLGSSPCVWSGS